MSPTRELATQIQSVVLALGDYMNVQCHACIGGTNIGEVLLGEVNCGRILESWIMDNTLCLVRLGVCLT
jgi:hypothetical protein